MEKYFEIRVGQKKYFVRQDEVEQVMMDPVTARIPFGPAMVYGLLYDGQELIPLLDLSRGSFGREKGFGRTCILLCRGGRRLAAAVSEVRDAPDGEKEGLEETDPFEPFFEGLWEVAEDTG